VNKESPARDLESGNKKIKLWFSKEGSLDQQHHLIRTSNTMPGVVALTCHPSYAGCVNRRTKVKTSLDINAQPYLKDD
jgi:hypothetical protein